MDNVLESWFRKVMIAVNSWLTYPAVSRPAPQWYRGYAELLSEVSEAARELASARTSQTNGYEAMKLPVGSQGYCGRDQRH